MIKLKIAWTDKSGDSQSLKMKWNSVDIEDSESVGHMLASAIDSETVRPWMVVASIIESMDCREHPTFETEVVRDLKANARKMIEEWRSHDARLNGTES